MRDAWRYIRPFVLGLTVGCAMMVVAVRLAMTADAHLPPITPPSGGCGELVHFGTYKDTAFYQLACWGKVRPVVSAESVSVMPRDPYETRDSIVSTRENH